MAYLFYINTNPDPGTICDYCQEILDAYTGVPIAEGSDLFWELDPPQHPNCFCEWLDSGLSDEEAEAIGIKEGGFSDFFNGLPERAQKLAAWGKMPVNALKTTLGATAAALLASQLDEIESSLAFIPVADEEEDNRARERVKELIRNGKANERITEIILKEFPSTAGYKALAYYGL